MRMLALAGVAAALAIAPGASSAKPGGAVEAPTREAMTDDGGVTPRAAPGSTLAARSSISRAGLRDRLERQMRSVGGASGAWVSDFKASRGRVLFSDSAKRRRLLASNTKLFTTAAFLDRFGAEGRLETSVWERGRRTGRHDQIVPRGLALVGDGDPAVSKPHVRALARQVRRSGIRRVRGGLRADDTIFDRKRFVPQPGISGGPYLSPMSGLSYNAGYDGGRFASRPEKVAAREFVRQLRKAGVRLRGGITIGDTPRKLRSREPVASVASPTAAALIARTNTPSDNFFAEMLLKRTAAREARQGTTARGARKAERFARRAGSGAELVNGSGLSRTNVSSPREVGKLLVHMGGDGALRGPFRGSLALAGRTGTLANRMRGTAAEGRCRAKTGTIDGVSALSGYCDAGAGLVAFSILMNGVDVDAARRAQDKMAALIARYR